MQKTTHEVLNELGIKDDPLLDVAMELERIALHDDYFIEKKLYPNIDFYSGITLKAMGFPTDDVHRAVRGRAHRRLDRAVEGNDRRSGAEDRPPPPALHRQDAARIQTPMVPLASQASAPRDSASISLLDLLVGPCASSFGVGEAARERLSKDRIRPGSAFSTAGIGGFIQRLQPPNSSISARSWIMLSPPPSFHALSQSRARQIAPSAITLIVPRRDVP